MLADGTGSQLFPVQVIWNIRDNSQNGFGGFVIRFHSSFSDSDL
jgi:hypothetical protein